MIYIELSIYKLLSPYCAYLMSLSEGRVQGGKDTINNNNITMYLHSPMQKRSKYWILDNATEIQTNSKLIYDLALLDIGGYKASLGQGFRRRF